MNISNKIFLASFLVIILLATSTFLTGCSKQKEELPSISNHVSFGNQDTDLFFDKKELKETGLSGKLIASIIIDETPQLVIFNTDTSEMKVLTDSKSWNRTPAFSIDGEKIFFSSGRNGTPQIFMYDLKKNKEKALTSTDTARYDPVQISNNEIVYNVFPDNGPFYLAKLNLETKKETTLQLTGEGIEKNLAIRGAEPAYDSKSNNLYFVNDLAFYNEPRPLNIWVANLSNGKAKRITDNKTIEVYTINNVQVSSPQFFDLNVNYPSSVSYGIRIFARRSQEEQPHLLKMEAHILDVKNNTDEVVLSSVLQLRNPIVVNKNYALVAFPKNKQIALINRDNKDEKLIFLSNTEFVGDFDFYSTANSD